MTRRNSVTKGLSLVQLLLLHVLPVAVECRGTDRGVEAENLDALPADLAVPAPAQKGSAAGTRVVAVTRGWEKTDVRHTLYLPRDWRPARAHPVIVEYPGNGGHQNDRGDVSYGTPDSCVLENGLNAGDRSRVVLCGFSRVAIACN